MSSGGGGPPLCDNDMIASLTIMIALGWMLSADALGRRMDVRDVVDVRGIYLYSVNLFGLIYT